MFVELLGRSCFSFLCGASQPEEYVARAKELGLQALALCDRDGLYGSVRAWNAARQIGQRVIVGAELTLELPGARSPAAPARAPTVALLAADHAGYRNLCRLLTRAHADRPKGASALCLEWLAAHQQGLVAVVPMPRVPGDEETPPDALFTTLAAAFPDRACIAVHRHHDGFDRQRTRAALTWAARHALPIVASARPLYHERSRKRLADVLHCIRRGITLDQAGTELSANAEAHLRSEQELLRLFEDQPEWVHKSGELADQLRFSLDELRYQFPCRLEAGETADQKLRRLTFLGAERRYPDGIPGAIGDQLEKELALIERHEMAPYFLSTWEIVEIARERRILCQGRGSAANSAVCYMLGITAVDPARSQLLFERFMSDERHEPPDIDVDFEHERREEVIQEIYRRYGRAQAAMVSEVICYRGKSALREVGKVFGLSPEQVARLSGALSHRDGAELAGDRLREIGFDPGDERVQNVATLARQLSGLPRHLSIHVGGFVLSASPLDEVAPVEPARMADRTVVPWDKDDLEDLGFFKVDVLGLGMLTAIRKALGYLHAAGILRRGERESFDPLEVITRIPAEDPRVYEMVSRADTIGVFQIESRAQMAMLPRLRPRCFYDLVIEVAIVRPGPIQGGMVHPYLKRRSGKEAIRSPHPDLAPILERTLGVPLFQEQVMQIAIEGAGYTGGEADQLRRDMAAWKKSGKLLRHRDRLLAGFAEKGIDRQFGEALFEQIKGFGDYGFPESHAASFALLVYATAWQKAHHPACFACALLNSQPMGFYSPSSIVRDAQAHGVTVRDVDVTRSTWDSSLEATFDRGAPDLRLGFRLVKGFAEATAVRIEQARGVAPFADLHDLIVRAGLPRDEIERLAEAGALETLVAGRRNALWRARTPRTEGLFREHALPEARVELPPLRAAETLLLDYERKTLSVDDHPLRHLRPQLAARGVLAAGDLGQARRGGRVRVAGLVLCRQRPGTASGIVFVTLEDETGICNVVVYRRVFERFQLPIRHARILLVEGNLECQLTEPPLGGPQGGPDRTLPIVHLIAERCTRLDLPEDRLRSISRDFH